MEELIQKLQDVHGLSPEQSHGILNTITSYIKEKFPMVGGAIDNLFASGTTPAAPTDATATATNAPQSGGGFFDKISQLIPGGASVENIEEIAKEKLGGLFGGNKTT